MKGKDGDGEEMPYQQLTRSLKDRHRLPGANHPPIVDHDDFIGELLDLLAIVRDVDDRNGQFVANTLQVREDSPPERNVDRGEGLVEQQNRGTRHQVLTQSDPLSFPRRAGLTRRPRRSGRFRACW